MYGYATAIGKGEDSFTIKFDNNDEEETELVTKMEVEQMMKLYRDNKDNQSQNNRKVMDEGNLNDELSNYYSLKNGDARTRKNLNCYFLPER